MRFAAAIDEAIVKYTLDSADAPRLRARAVAAHMRLSLLPVPFQLPPFDMRIYWHRQVDTDLRNQWLRSQLELVAAGLDLGRPRRAARSATSSAT